MSQSKPNRSIGFPSYSTRFPETPLCDSPSTTRSSDKLHFTTRSSFFRLPPNPLRDGRRNGLSHLTRSLTSYVSWQRFLKRLANCRGSLIQLHDQTCLDTDHSSLPQNSLLPVPPRFAAKPTSKPSSHRILRHPSHLYFAKITLRVRF